MTNPDPPIHPGQELPNDKKTPQKHLVDFEPVGRRILVEPGTNLLQAAQQAGVDLISACSGIGFCGTCLVRQVRGELTPPTSTEEEYLLLEEIADGCRLACQAVPLSDVLIEIPSGSLLTPQRMQVDGQEVSIRPDPKVITLDLALSPPSLEDLRSDLTRVNQAVSEAGYAPLQGEVITLSHLSQQLRREEWTARLALQPGLQASYLVAALPPGASYLGLAVDIGTTKLAAYLVDLSSGGTLATTSAMNPQISFGEDVVSRIAFANQGDEYRWLLQTRLVETLNTMVADLCERVQAAPEQVVDAVMVGNTAMHHFFCRLPVEQLGIAPYVPAVSDPLDVRAEEIGLRIARGAWIHLPANIAGFVGADHTAVLLTTQAYTADKTLVVVDIGTNTEISLLHQGRLFTCSCASGPAFEGAHIHDGMRAAPGAIERVRITAAGVQVTTIESHPAVGICGSGILQAVAEMLQAGILDERGMLQKQNPRVQQVQGKPGFVLVPREASGHGREIVVTRKDVHEIQLAKSAIRTGIEILMEEAQVSAHAIEEWIIAGAFGTYLDLESAIRVGMFPAQPVSRFHQVGNAAGVGAKQMLISRTKRQEAGQIANRVNYIELTTSPHFTEKFIQAMYLGNHLS